MIKRPSKRSVLITLLIVFVAIQMKTTDKTPLKITPESDFLTLEEAPQEVTKLFQSTCYDCHSNVTRYPWYSNVAPVSWWLEGHINKGRSKVNF
ncbi:MAG: heme-binding domain-containing protein, partial [Flavobacteriales bacterium]|nr:heme-binding domain-containing protein [Flavobacteriales bacterium]